MNNSTQSINVLVLQTKNISQKDCRDGAAFIDQRIAAHNQQLSACHKRQIDFVVLPEDWLQDEEYTVQDEFNREVRCYKDGSKHVVDLESNKCLQKISEIVKKHQVYAVLGSLHEKLDMEKKGFNTCVILNREGQIICAHRKRRDEDVITIFPFLTLQYEFGTEPGIFQTEYGTMAVMICLDVENEDVFLDTLSYHPVIMFNPTWIPAKNTTTSSTARIAMETMSRKFEVLCTQHNFVLVRCDASNTSMDRSFHGENLYGMGTSQVIGPYSTMYAPHQGDASFVVEIDLSTSSSNNNFQRITIEPSTSRTDIRDNTGNRYTLSTIVTDEPVTCLCFLDQVNLLYGTSAGSIGTLQLGNRSKKVFHQLGQGVTQVSYCKEANIAFWVTEDEIVQWNTKENKQMNSTKMQSKITCAAIQDAKHLLVGLEAGKIQVLNFSMDALFSMELEAPPHHINSWKHDGKIFLLVSDGTAKLFLLEEKNATSIWTLQESVKVIRSFFNSHCINLVTQEEILVLNISSLELNRAKINLQPQEKITDGLLIREDIFLFGLNNGDLLLWYSKQNQVIHRFYGLVSVCAIESLWNRVMIVTEDGELKMLEFSQNRVPKQLSELLS